MVYWPLWTVTFVVCHRGNELQSMSPSCTCSLVAAKNVLGKASDANRGMAGSKLELKGMTSSPSTCSSRKA